MRLVTIIAAAAFATSAAAQDQPTLTVEQCLSVLGGLNALNCVGQQLQGQCAPDSKQYKLGEARFTIGADIAALNGVLTTYQRAQQQFMLELPPLPQAEPGKTPPLEAAERQAEQNKKSVANQTAMLAKPCPVTPGRLKLQELKLGDGPDQNAVPPSVLAAFSPIVDR